MPYVILEVSTELKSPGISQSLARHVPVFCPSATWSFWFWYTSWTTARPRPFNLEDVQIQSA